MLLFTASSLAIIAAVQAGGYGGSASAGYGGARSYSAPVARGGARGAAYRANAGGYGGVNYVKSNYVIPATIQTTHNIEYRDVPSSGQIQAATVEVGANAIPMNIFFRSASTVLNVHQVHQNAQGTFHQSQSEDEPHRLVHEVTKPIYQEVREIVIPYRKVIQEIRPVQENVNTIVATGGSRKVLAANPGQFTQQNGELVGNVATQVVSNDADSGPIVQQQIEQQQIVDDSNAELSAQAPVEQVEQVEQVVQSQTAEAY